MLLHGRLTQNYLSRIIWKEIYENQTKHIYFVSNVFQEISENWIATISSPVSKEN